MRLAYHGRVAEPVDDVSPVVLSTSSVFPESTASAFALARQLGYDGIELMVGADSVSAEVDQVAELSAYHEVPVLAVHAPTLLLTQRTWGTDPWEKLERSAMAANQLGASVVVVHPPFRWQRGYAQNFTTGVRRLAQNSGVRFAVENMYPWRGPGGGELRAYAPSWDCAQLDCDHLTLDLSHAATARLSSLDLVRDWGERLAHVHLTDGTHSSADEHLMPGDGDQEPARVLAELVNTGYRGQIVLEVSTRGMSRTERRDALAGCLTFTRRALSREGQR